MAEQAIDSNKAKFSAEQFLKRLTDDYRFGRDVETMDGVVQGLLPRDAKDQVLFDEAARKQAAQTLIFGLDKLNKQGDIPQAVKDSITKVFADNTLTTVKQLATQLKDQMRTQEILTLLNSGNVDFGFSYNNDQLKYIRDLWNGLSPGDPNSFGLGDVLSMIMGGGDTRDSEQIPTAHSELSQGFYVMFQGQTALANFWDREEVDGKDFRVWNPPGNDHDREAFFSKEGMGRYEYQFYDSDAEAYRRSFEDMILAKWEKDGVIKFGNSQAREHFIEYVKGQVMQDGELGAEFSSALLSKGQIEFASSEARAKFDGFTAGLRAESGYRDMSSYDIAEKIREYVAEHGDVKLPEDGTYAFESEFTDTIWMYRDARTPDDFAGRVMTFAEWYPGNGIIISEPEGHQQRSVTAMMGAPDKAPNATTTFTTAATNPAGVDDSVSVSTTAADRIEEIRTEAENITAPPTPPEFPAVTPTSIPSVVQPG